MTWLISHLFVRIFSFLANFCTIKKPFNFNWIAQRPMFTGVCTAELWRLVSLWWQVWITVNCQVKLLFFYVVNRWRWAWASGFCLLAWDCDPREVGGPSQLRVPMRPIDSGISSGVAWGTLLPPARQSIFPRRFRLPWNFDSADRRRPMRWRLLA